MFKNFYLKTALTVLLTAIFCSYFGQILLFLIDISKDYYMYLLYFIPFILIFTKYGNKITKTNGIGMKYFIDSRHDTNKNVPLLFAPLLALNTFLAHIFGVSVGREGVAVQLGASIGLTMSKGENLEKRNFLIRLGMICGFSALFQTPLAAIFFILEITTQKEKFTKKYFYEAIIYLIASFFSTRLSHLLGLEKFFVTIHVDFNILTFPNFVKILVSSLLLIIAGILFVLCQKYFKKICKNDNRITWILVALFMIISFVLSYRYASLGTNLISFSFNNEHIYYYDFILKLILTALCTAVGFSGGEVTPLFAIGASFGVVLATIFNLPILIIAALGYVLVFSAATKTFITPIFLALEVFGWNTMIISILPALLIYFINKKYSIYN